MLGALKGFVILKPLPQRKIRGFGNIKKNSERSVIVDVGPADHYEMDARIKEGVEVIMPRAGKQEFVDEGQTYYTVHHKELRVYFTKKENEDEKPKQAPTPRTVGK